MPGKLLLENAFAKEEELLGIRVKIVGLFASGAVLAQEVNVQEGNELYRTYCW